MIEKHTDEHGLLHREDGPACLWADGHKEWWIHGNLHREDGPAIVCGKGSEEWYINNELHREDGPAWTCSFGTFWFINGVSHREDGPSDIWSDGSTEWHILGTKITTWKEYHELSTLSPQEQMIVKLKYGEQLS